jgi:hypothetical protein
MDQNFGRGLPSFFTIALVLILIGVLLGAGTVGVIRLFN